MRAADLWQPEFAPPTTDDVVTADLREPEEARVPSHPPEVSPTLIVLIDFLLRYW
jgi:hypothetical protein